MEGEFGQGRLMCSAKDFWIVARELSFQYNSRCLYALYAFEPNRNVFLRYLIYATVETPATNLLPRPDHD